MKEPHLSLWRRLASRFENRMAMRWYRAGIREERRRVLALIQLAANDGYGGAIQTPHEAGILFVTCRRIATLVGEP